MNETQRTYKIKCTDIKDKIAMKFMNKYIDIYKMKNFIKYLNISQKTKITKIRNYKHLVFLLYFFY